MAVLAKWPTGEHKVSCTTLQVCSHHSHHHHHHRRHHQNHQVDHHYHGYHHHLYHCGRRHHPRHHNFFLFNSVIDQILSTITLGSHPSKTKVDYLDLLIIKVSFDKRGFFVVFVLFMLI